MSQDRAVDVLRKHFDGLPGTSYNAVLRIVEDVVSAWEGDEAKAPSTEPAVSSLTPVDKLYAQVNGLKGMVKQYAMPTECNEAIKQKIGALERERDLLQVCEEIRPLIESNPGYVGRALILLGFHCAPVKSVGRTAAEFFIICEINPGTNIPGLCAELTAHDYYYEITSYGDCEGEIKVNIA